MKKINHDVISRYTTERLEKFLIKNIDLGEDVLFEVLSIISSRYWSINTTSSLAGALALYNFNFFAGFLRSKSTEFINRVLMINDDKHGTIGNWLGRRAEALR